MRFVPSAIPGAWSIEPEAIRDERGHFARIFCSKVFHERGLPGNFVQWSLCYNEKIHTLRGLHLQDSPHPEAKLVRCIRGALYDVLVDLRPESASYLSWETHELTAENRRCLYVPPGVAHGYLTLAAHSEVMYHMDEEFHPELQRGVRWDDPRLAIPWPATDPILSARDRSFPDL